MFRCGIELRSAGNWPRCDQEEDSWVIVVPPEETKTNTHLEFQIPEALHEQFLNYLDLVRPRMLRVPGCKALWVSPKGGALSYSAVGAVITRHSTSVLAFE